MIKIIRINLKMASAAAATNSTFDASNLWLLFNKPTESSPNERI